MTDLATILPETTDEEGRDLATLGGDLTPGQFVKGEFRTAGQIGKGTIEELRDQLLRMIPKMPAIPATKELPPSEAITPTRPVFPEAVSTAPVKIGKTLGDILGFLGASAVGGAGAAALPETAIAKVLRAAPGRIAGTALYGQAVSPERARGAETGAALQTAVEAIPYVGKGIGAVSKYVRPQTLTNDIMSSLSKGQTLEENGKNFATNLKNSFNRKIEASNDLYNPIFDRVGNNSVYYSRVKSPEFYKNMFDPVTRDPLDEGILDDYLPDLKKLHSDFIKNPTFQNAHDLQSQLGFEIRRLQRMPSRSMADTRVMQNYTKAKDNLKGDMDHFLEYKEPGRGLADQYEDATNYYRNEVVPYLSNSNIAKIARGKITNPKNITTIFKNPDEDVLKVVEDLGDNGKNQILYNELGKVSNMTPEKLISETNKLDKKGLSGYLTPDLQGNIDQIASRIKAKEVSQRLAGAASAAALIPFHAGAVPEITAALAGGALSPAIMRSLQKTIPVGATMKAATKVYPWLSKAAIAALLGGQ